MKWDVKLLQRKVASLWRPAKKTHPERLYQAPRQEMRQARLWRPARWRRISWAMCPSPWLHTCWQPRAPAATFLTTYCPTRLATTCPDSGMISVLKIQSSVICSLCVCAYPSSFTGSEAPYFIEPVWCSLSFHWWRPLFILINKIASCSWFYLQNQVNLYKNWSQQFNEWNWLWKKIWIHTTRISTCDKSPVVEIIWEAQGVFAVSEDTAAKEKQGFPPVIKAQQPEPRAGVKVLGFRGGYDVM